MTYAAFSDFKERPTLLEINKTHFEHNSGTAGFEKERNNRNHRPTSASGSNLIYTTKEWVNRFANPSRKVSIRNETDVTIYICWRDGVWQAIFPTNIGKKRNRVFIRSEINAEVCETMTPEIYYKDLVETAVIADNRGDDDAYNQQLNLAYEEAIGNSRTGGLIATEIAIKLEELNREHNGVYVKEYDVCISLTASFLKAPHPYSNPHIQFAARQECNAAAIGHGLHIRYRVVDKRYQYGHMFINIGGTVEAIPIDRSGDLADGVYVIRSSVTPMAFNSAVSNTFFSTLNGCHTDRYSFEEAAKILRIHPTRELAASSDYDIRKKQLEIDIATVRLKERDLQQKAVELEARIGETIYRANNDFKRSVEDNRRIEFAARAAVEDRRQEIIRQHAKDSADKMRYKRETISDALKIVTAVIATATAVMVFVNKKK